VSEVKLSADLVGECPLHGKVPFICFLVVEEWEREDWERRACFKCYAEAVRKLVSQHQQNALTTDRTK